MTRSKFCGWWILPLVVALGLASCRDKGGEQAADAELAEAGYELTPTDWMRACSEGNKQVVRRFLDGGFKVDARDAAGDTGAHAAAAAGRSEVITLLLDRGLAVDVVGVDERTPLMTAVLADQPVMVRELLRQGADANLRDGDGFSPLMLAVREGHAGVVEELAGHDREHLDDALLLAALVGQAGVIDVLTNYGASVFARMNDGRTALMLAAENGHVDAVELLVDLGASRYSTSNDGRTASDIASDAGFPEVQMLIEGTTRDVAMRLDSEDEMIRNMTAYVDLVSGTETARKGEAPAGDPVAGGGRPAVTDEPTVLLGGAVVSPRVRESDGGTSATAEGAAEATAPAPPAPPPLVMRHYQQRELPIRVREVSGDSALIEMGGKEIREVRVARGEVIPDTTIEVVRVYKRVERGKLNDGEPVEVAVLDVRDTRNGRTRAWYSGEPALTHDPAALVEDAVSGRRYVAIAGQRFTADDGSVFVVSEVRPNQLVITGEDSGVVHTLPLRGPRG